VGVDREDGIDVTLPGGAETAVERAHADASSLDAIVHAVGMSGRRLGDGPVTSCTDEAWSEVHRVNLESVFRLLRCGLPVLRMTRGAFVTVGSVLGRATDEDFLTAAYAASKGALETLTRVAAREVAPEGVRVNLVAAGLVATPMARRALTDDHIKNRLRELQPLGACPLQPEDVAEAVIWLLSDAARRVTGVALPVDAGWSLR
jgi:NAD(P)-dependent dehydrogenase (short-subunit alcohol dehydrogenase family)